MRGNAEQKGRPFLQGEHIGQDYPYMRNDVEDDTLDIEYTLTGIIAQQVELLRALDSQRTLNEEQHAPQTSTERLFPPAPLPSQMPVPSPVASPSITPAIPAASTPPPPTISPLPAPSVPSAPSPRSVSGTPQFSPELLPSHSPLLLPAHSPPSVPSVSTALSGSSASRPPSAQSPRSAPSSSAGQQLPVPAPPTPLVPPSLPTTPHLPESLPPPAPLPSPAHSSAPSISPMPLPPPASPHLPALSQLLVSPLRPAPSLPSAPPSLPVPLLPRTLSPSPAPLHPPLFPSPPAPSPPTELSPPLVPSLPSARLPFSASPFSLTPLCPSAPPPPSVSLWSNHLRVSSQNSPITDPGELDQQGLQSVKTPFLQRTRQLLEPFVPPLRWRLQQNLRGYERKNFPDMKQLEEWQLKSKHGRPVLPQNIPPHEPLERKTQQTSPPQENQEQRASSTSQQPLPHILSFFNILLARMKHEVEMCRKAVWNTHAYRNYSHGSDILRIKRLPTWEVEGYMAIFESERNLYAEIESSSQPEHVMLKNYIEYRITHGKLCGNLVFNFRKLKGSSIKSQVYRVTIRRVKTNDEDHSDSVWWQDNYVTNTSTLVLLDEKGQLDIMPGIATAIEVDELNRGLFAPLPSRQLYVFQTSIDALLSTPEFQLRAPQDTVILDFTSVWRPTQRNNFC